MTQLMKNYQHNEKLRQSFNALSEKTFGLNFENWYQNGYWRGNYIPYSMVCDEKVIANVSVNLTTMVWNGQKKHYIQLGTVMTEEGYRNQGLIREIIKEIHKDYHGKIDGMYLFANDSVLEFYPKFNFRKATEYQYKKKVKIAGKSTIEQIPMQDKAAWDLVEKAIKESKPCGKFEMIDNVGLYMFYVTNFMQENVYYEKQLDVYVIAEVEGATLFLQNVFAPKEVELDKVIQAFGSEITQVVLGFVPKKSKGYETEKICQEDTTLFLQGEGREAFEREQLSFPMLAHA